MIPYPGGGDAYQQESISQHYVAYPISIVPCPVSLVPFYKYEGASGDVYENKGTGKFLAPYARK